MILNDEVIGRTGPQKDIDKLIEHARKYNLLSLPAIDQDEEA